MNCPVCDGRLRTVEKYGVEIDICPECKGVWLDRGELDKIIDMVSSGGPVQSEANSRPMEPRQEYRSDHNEHGHDKRYDNPGNEHHNEKDYEYDPRTGKRRRRESWFSNIFEAFGGED